jgi:iron complex outermembrane recepter protein
MPLFVDELDILLVFPPCECRSLKINGFEARIMMNRLNGGACTRGALVFFLALYVTLFVSSSIAQETEEIDEIEVIGITPTHGVGLPEELIPTHVQRATSDDLNQSQSLDLTEFMNRNLGSVSINAAQNNPLQPNIQYRGFTVSPLLGLPQGIAVYQDGVRIMEPFGDTINWELIPESAIASINLIGGANPLFGLNTLGGSLIVDTKDGFSHPGYRGELYGGSFGRVVGQAEAGWNNDEFGYFATVNYFDEDGWRDQSPSDVKNFFGKASWHGEDSTINIGFTYGDGKLIGNGPAPVQLLEIDRKAVFTLPDITENNMQMVILDGTHWFNDTMLLSSNVFYRDIDTNAFNGDGTEFEACDVAGEVILVDEFEDFDGDGECTAADDFGIVLDQDRNPFLDAAEFDAINNIGALQQASRGGSLQQTILNSLFGRENRLIFGAAYQKGEADFRSIVEVATLRQDRSTLGVGRFVPDEATDVSTHTSTWSLYFTNIHNLSQDVAVTIAARFNSTQIDINDLSGDQPELNGSHQFDRFNPAVGLTWQATPSLNIYGSYSESSRAPTPVELTCADPDAPCNLPNAFLADPPLEQVVARSFETGLRGQIDQIGSADDGTVNWHAGIFHTSNDNDIIFQSTGGVSANEGFFDNVANTIRRGIEVGLNGDIGRLNWFVNYAFVNAEFDDSFTGTSPNHPFANDGGEIEVEKGDRIPGIPEHTLKLGTSVAITPRMRLGGEIIYNSGRFLRGDEANLLDETNDFAVVNLRGEFNLSDRVSLFAKVENLFDTEYETFGLLGEADEILGPDFDDPRFLGPGPARGAWVGIRVNSGY